MTRKYQNRFVLLSLVLVTFLALAQSVQACRCPDGDDSTLGKFESARFVVVNKIISVNKEPRVRIVYSGAEVINEPFMAITSITMIVEKVYKGDLKAGDEMTFGQGESECLMEFQEEEVGAKFLFYLEPKEKKPKLWYADSCERSIPLPNYPTNHVKDTADDLLYLDKMNEVGGKTRISGVLMSYQWSIADGGADLKKLAGRKVQIVGNGKSYEALTNAEGVYEIYDLPVGTYAIRPADQQGWAIDVDSGFGGFSSGRNEDDGSSHVPLQAGRHAYASFIFKVDNRLSGRVLDESGRPLPWVCLRLLVITDQQGNFSLNVLKGLAGEVSAGVRLDPKEFENCPALLRVSGKISLDRRTEAIRVQADRRIDGVDLRLPFPTCKGEKIFSQMRVD